MSFDDVRSGDMITVEVHPKENPPYRVMGTALVEGERISIPGAAFQVYKFAGAWVECDITRLATLIDHTPAEPEWHRAKVIKANVAGRPTELLFWVEARKAWATADLLGWPKDAPTNVTVIVDEHGEVRA